MTPKEIDDRIEKVSVEIMHLEARAKLAPRTRQEELYDDVDIKLLERNTLRRLRQRIGG